MAKGNCCARKIKPDHLQNLILFKLRFECASSFESFKTFSESCKKNGLKPLTVQKVSLTQLKLHLKIESQNEWNG